MTDRRLMQQQVLETLQRAVDAGLLRVTTRGHFAITHVSCKTCGAELKANSPNNGTGPLGYCIRCRGEQIRGAWRRRRGANS